MNQEKLAKLQAQVRIGGKVSATIKGVCFGWSLRNKCFFFFMLLPLFLQGSARRKKKVVHRTASADDKKLQFSLKKLGVNNISGIEEVQQHIFSENNAEFWWH